MRISDWSSDVCSSDLTLCVGDAASAAEEVGIERRVVLVRLVDVAAGGVGLPDLDQRVGLRAPRLVEHAAGDGDALANGLSGGLPGWRPFIAEIGRASCRERVCSTV